MRKIFALLYALMFALPAQASPPDILGISDRVIGASQSQLFVLREADNNLGLNFYGLTDVYLIAKNIKTGVDAEIWPVYRVHAAVNRQQDAVLRQSFALADAVNPFTILADRNAQYTPLNFTPLGAPNAPETSLGPDMLRVGDREIATETVLGLATGALVFTAAVLQPYPEGDFAIMTRLSPKELMRAPNFTYEDCEVEGFMRLPRYPQKDLQLVRVFCMNGDALVPASIVVIMP